LPYSPPGDLADPGIEPMSPAFADGFFLPVCHLGCYTHFIIYSQKFEQFTLCILEKNQEKIVWNAVIFRNDVFLSPTYTQL